MVLSDSDLIKPSGENKPFLDDFSDSFDCGTTLHASPCQRLIWLFLLFETGVSIVKS